MNTALRAAINEFIVSEKLPQDYFDTVEQWFIPLAEEVLQKVSVSQEPLVVGISGCQGSGKSTLAELLVVLLKQMIGLNSINLSIDDFYLTHAERQTKASNLHPLFSTRGVPGTHDVRLALDTIAALKKSAQVAIPRFDKANDDRLPKNQWPIVKAPVDVIILEGWCLNIEEQPVELLLNPINKLEEDEDHQGIWRTAVNKSIGSEYQALYSMVDFLIMLKPPSFEKVFEWRQRQENKLISKLKATDNNTASSRVMNPEQLERFIHHYERITRHGLLTLPAQADVVFELSHQQGILQRVISS